MGIISRNSTNEGKGRLNKHNAKRNESIVILACSLIAAFEVLISSAKYGPGITHDSAAYMYAAQSLLNGEGLQYFGYVSPYIQWPPLLPVMLAIAGIAGLNSLTAALIINSLAYALIIFFSGRWLFSRSSCRTIAACGTALLAISVPLLQVSKYLWTESTFLLFLVLFFIQFERFIQEGRYSSLAAAAVFSALACLDRYAGVMIIGTAGLFLLFSGGAFIKRIKNTAFFGIISSLPMGIWVIRNYSVSSTLLGVRISSSYTLRQNIERTLKAIYTWIQPENYLAVSVPTVVINIMKVFSVLLPVFIAVVYICLSVKSLISDHSSKSSGISPTHSSCKAAKQELFPITFFLSFSVLYLAYLIASATAVAFEPINSRYVVPIYIPAVLALLTAADQLYRYMHERGSKMVFFHIIYIVIAVCYLVYPLLNTASAVSHNYRNGAGGYAAEQWHKNTDFLEYMKDGQASYYSNYADAVYYLSGIRTFSPPKKSGPPMYGIEGFKHAVINDKASYIIWFSKGASPALYNPDELAEMFELKEIGDFNNGSVFMIVKSSKEDKGHDVVLFKEG